jgi:hypothetical protein
VLKPGVAPNGFRSSAQAVLAVRAAAGPRRNYAVLLHYSDLHHTSNLRTHRYRLGETDSMIAPCRSQDASAAMREDDELTPPCTVRTARGG